VRFLCANTHPDHDTICTFRRENQALFQESFVKVLQLARELRILKVGQVTTAHDGTKIQANASKHTMRGKAKAALEWTLVTLSYNLRRLHGVQKGRRNEGRGGETS